MILPMEWSHKLILDFLNLYKNEPTIWNMSTLEHNNKYDAYEAWKRIKTQLYDGNVPIHEIKKKRDSLMATYRRQKVKVKNSMRHDAGEVLKPKWPFYDIMNAFLDDIYEPRETKNVDISEDPSNVKDVEDDAEEGIVDDEKVQAIIHMAKKNGNKKMPHKKRKIHEYHEITKRKNKDCTIFKEMNLKPEPDECSLYCELLCKKLRGLKESTRELAMLEIDKLIYNIKQQDILTVVSQSLLLQQQDPLQTTG